MVDSRLPEHVDWASLPAGLDWPEVRDRVQGGVPDMGDGLERALELGVDLLAAHLERDRLRRKIDRDLDLRDVGLPDPDLARLGGLSLGGAEEYDRAGHDELEAAFDQIGVLVTVTEHEEAVFESSRKGESSDTLELELERRLLL